MFRAAKLVADDREYLCIVRDVSSSGVKARVFHPIPDSDELEVETGSGERFPVKLVWIEDGYAGFCFRNEIDIDWLIDEKHGPFPKRQLRLRIDVPAKIQSGGQTYDVVLHNISQQGACIECEHPLLISETIQIEFRSIPPIFAKVRWRRKPMYGLVFEHTFRLDELAVLLAAHNSGADQPRPPKAAASGKTA